MKCLKCPNQSPWDWDDVSDAQTGTMYVRCRKCGAHRMASPSGFVDWRVGLMLESGAAVGSAWTQKVSPELLPELSRLSNASQA